MTREVDGQQTQSVIYSLLNKRWMSPGSEINASVICTKCSFQTLLNFVKPVQTQ